MQAKEIDAAVLVSSTRNYEGAFIRIKACVNVTIHDITLLQCGTRGPQINFKVGQGEGSDQAYSRLVKYAHDNMGRMPEELPVTIEGIYRQLGEADEAGHVIFLTEFYGSSNSQDGDD